MDTSIKTILIATYILLPTLTCDGCMPAPTHIDCETVLSRNNPVVTAADGTWNVRWENLHPMQ